MRDFTGWRWILGSCGCLLLAGQSFGQSVAPIPAAKPIEAQIQRSRPSHFSLCIDGTAVSISAPGLKLIREPDSHNTINFQVIGYRLGNYAVVVSVAKEGKISTIQYVMKVRSPVLFAEKLP